jgi:hypothetical protein
VAFWGALIAAPVDQPTVNVVATSPAHRPGVAEWGADVAHRVYAEVDLRSRKLGRSERTRIARAILEEATRAAMDPLLVVAVIHVESRFDPGATSGVGAIGLMQLLRPTMQEEAERSRLDSADPRNPIANVRAGVRYLRRMVAAFRDVDLALMAYNAGPNRIRRHLRAGGVPERFLEYPRRVARERERLSAAADGVPPPLWASHAREASQGAPAPLPARTLAAHRPDLAPPARGAAPALLAVAPLTRARSPGAGSNAPRPRSRS